MESSNLHHHQLQELVGSSSPSTNTHPYGVSSTHSWTGINLDPNYNGLMSNSNPRNHNMDSINLVSPPHNPTAIHELARNWFTNQENDYNSKIKTEISETLPKFTDMLNTNNDLKDFNDLSEKLLLKTISSGFRPNIVGNSYFYDFPNNANAMPPRGNFSQIYPSINISNFNQIKDSSSNSQDFDGRLYGGSYGSINNQEIVNVPLIGGDHLQLSGHQGSSSPSTVYCAETKRLSSLVEPKTTETAPKKSRVESRASCPPFKVRKEKLGDRVASLQQLVAPFGKTDTASVLMEAIGYIKFLQNQVETLSVPYMKSSRIKTRRSTHMVSTTENEDEQQRQDLRSRGLCLVPLSCMSYVTGDGGGVGGGVWPPLPDFGGGN